jgi:hypothetical protein
MSMVLFISNTKPNLFCRDKIPDILYFTQYALPGKVWQSFQGDFTYLFPDRGTYNIKDPFKMFLLFLYNSTPQL